MNKHWRGAAFSAAVLIIWAVLAARRPTLTYHFAPLISGVAWPLATRYGGRAETATATTAAGLSFLVTAAVAVGLSVADQLRGPTFVSETGAVWEAVLFGAVGALLGARAASREKAGLLGSIFAE